MEKRHRRVKSVSIELLHKAREAALAAVQIYNNPTIQFKSELFIVTMNIAWTYLLHAYFRKTGIDYRYARLIRKRRTFEYTKNGAHRHWDLEKCLNDKACPFDEGTKNNLRFLNGIRHEIEHQMTNRIDRSLSAKFQASCLNFNTYIKSLFGSRYRIDHHLAFSLQFSSISPDQKDLLTGATDLPRHIESFIAEFENKLSDEQFEDMHYAYRVLFVQKTANRKGQEDKVIEFVKNDSEVTKTANYEYEKVFLKEVDRKKYLAKEIVALMQKEGFPGFGMIQHTNLWKALDARNSSKGYSGSLGHQWYWFEPWLKQVRKHCEENREKYQHKKAIP
jgi:hypothetical protein